MKGLRFIIVAAILSASLLGSSCLNIYISGTGLKPPPDSTLARTATTAETASADPDIKKTVLPPADTPNISTGQKNAPLLAIAGLLLIWLFYRTYLGDRVKKQGAQLDAEDLALIRVASDALDDFWHRHNSKRNSNIILFPKA